MKTRITRSKGWIALIVDDNSQSSDDHQVLAAMTLQEGTGCWQLTDIRLSQYIQPSPYSGSLKADTLCAGYKPESPEEMDYLKTRLREYSEYESMILWCSFDGLVRGHASVNDYTPVRWANFDQAGYFSQSEGLEKLMAIQTAWNDIESLASDWRLENIHRQPSLADIRSELIMIKNGQGDLVEKIIKKNKI